MKIWLKNIFNNHSKSLSENQQIILLSNLNNLLKSGFTLLECFNFINLYFNYKNKDIANKIINIIKTGGECNQILELIGYPKSVVTQIQFSQKYGNINDSLEEVINYLKTNLQAKQRILKAIQYPIILISIFITMLSILNYTVLPQFEHLYSTMDVELNLSQTIITYLISHLPQFFLLILFVLLILSIIVIIFLNKIDMSRKLMFISYIPIVHFYYSTIKTYQIANDLAMFYKNDISIQQVVDMYIHQQNNPFLNYIGIVIQKELSRGINLSDILIKIPCYQYDLTQFIKQGEKNNKLDIELKMYCQILIQRLQNKALKQSKIIQPIVFIFLGIFIVSLYLVIMLPMFQLMQNIK
ncbi:competence protein ComGB [Staphylococcus hominis]